MDGDGRQAVIRGTGSVQAFVALSLLLGLARSADAVEWVQSETAPPSPNMYLFLYLRGVLPLLHTVQDVPGGGALGWTQGWWGPGVRVGWNLEFGVAPCAICEPYSSSWVTVVVGGDVSFEAWRRRPWSLVGGVRPRLMIAAVNSDHASKVPIDNRVLWEPQLSLALWHDLSPPHRGWRSEWVIELDVEEWLHGHESSPAIGLALGYDFGAPM